MDSFFKKLRKLRESEKEDFLTEIFAFALEKDLDFRKSFLTLLPSEFQDSSTFIIQTQVKYKIKDGRERIRIPDIQIIFDNAFLLIESKLSSEEHTQQLNDYAKILSKKVDFEHKRLVYLTSKFDEKNYCYKDIGVDFQQLRWFEISAKIINTSDLITKELRQYLMDEKIVMKKFAYQDLIAINTFFETVQKMNDILKNDVSTEVKNKGLFRYQLSTLTLRDKEYILLLNYKSDANLSFGFANWWDEHPCFFIRLNLGKSIADRKEQCELIKKSLNSTDWYCTPTNQGKDYIVEIRKRLLDILEFDSEVQRKKITTFFSNGIDDLVRIKPQFNDIFKE